MSNPLPPETELGPEWVGDELPPERTFEGENPNNSLTRADTYGIRPDIFGDLVDVLPNRPELDELMKRALEALANSEEALGRAESALGDSALALERSDTAVSASGEALKKAASALEMSESAVSESAVAQESAVEARRVSSEAQRVSESSLSVAGVAQDRARSADVTSESGLRTALEALEEASRANSAAIVSTNSAVAANRAAGEANSNSILALNRGLVATNQAVSAVQAATDLNSVAIAATNQAVVATNTATAANSAAVRSSNQAIRALTETVKLQHLNNFGVWNVEAGSDFGRYITYKEKFPPLGVEIVEEFQSPYMRQFFRVTEPGVWQIIMQITVPGMNVGSARFEIAIDKYGDSYSLESLSKRRLETGEETNIAIATVFLSTQDRIGLEIWIGNNSSIGGLPQNLKKMEERYARLSTVTFRQLSRVGQPVIPAGLLA